MKESNVSNLTRTLAVLSLLAPGSAYPLGIGEIKLHSALNQNLDAEISLMLSAGERISDIKVSLAPPDKFDERGVPWSYFLSNINLEPVLRPDGSAVIRVRSREALKEPILDLLLQVTWPKGTSYRQFSLMVDPPAAYAQPTVPVTRVPEAVATVVRAPSEPPAISAPPAPREPSSYVPKSRPVAPDSVALAPNPVRRAPKDDIVKGIYGPTRRNDTLWGIAEKAGKRYKVSVEQMMVAIYQANPGAFYKDNVNALQTGVKVKIPPREAVVKLSRQEALAEFNRQKEAWKSRTQPVSSEAAKAAPPKETPDEKPIENQLTLAAPAEGTVAAKAVITPGQEQNASKAEADKTEADKSEAGSADAKANEEMRERMAALEQQLAKMQAVLAIKDQQLAALQSQLQQAPKPEVAPPVPTAQPQGAVQLPQPSPVTVPQPAPGSAAADQATAPASAVIAQEQPAQQPQPAPKQAANPAVKPAVKKPARPPAPAPEAFEEPLPLELIGGAGAAILSLLGIFWWRKRKIARDAELNNESMFSPSIIYKAPESESTFSVPVLNENAAYDVNPVGESSFLSEFTPSDFDAFDNDQGEIDPISEADVYLAYGRYEQAEELMRNAVAAHPDRDECKLKLLEIYYASENKTGFEAFAKELSLEGKNQEPVFWEKVKEMGREICPDSSLFSGKAAAASGMDGQSAGVSEPVALAKQNAPARDDFELQFDSEADLAAFDAAFAENAEPAQADGLAGEENIFADFDQSDFSLDTAAQEEPRNNESIDFNLDKFADLEPESETRINSEGAADLQAAAEKNDFDLESFDFESDFSAIEGSKEEKAEEPSAHDLQLENRQSPDEQPAELQLSSELNDFDLDSFAFDTGFAESGEVEEDAGTLAADQFNVTEEAPADDKQEIALPDDFNFDFDFSTFGDDASEDDPVEVSGVEDLTDMDELETKLDLARAYRDMGDSESAKDIVSEVLEKGSAEQKKLAQVLLDELM